MAKYTNLYPKIKEMYENGTPINNIKTELNITGCTLYRALFAMGISCRHLRGDAKLEAAGLTYADNKVVLEKVIIDGKSYVDVTPVLIPR